MKKEKNKITGPVRVFLIAVIIVLYVISVNGVLVGVDLLHAAKEAKNVIGTEQIRNQYGLMFDGTEQANTLQYLNVVGISEAFYPDMDSSEDFYFAEEEEYGYFVVSMFTAESIWNDILGSKKSYEDYFYGETDEIPEVDQVVGVPLPFTEQMKPEIMERWNYIWDEEILTNENFEEYFGTCYLYILPFGAKSVSQLFFKGWLWTIGGIVIVLVLLLCFCALIPRKKSKKKKAKIIA